MDPRLASLYNQDMIRANFLKGERTELEIDQLSLKFKNINADVDNLYVTSIANIGRYPRLRRLVWNSYRYHATVQDIMRIKNTLPLLEELMIYNEDDYNAGGEANQDQRILDYLVTLNRCFYYAIFISSNGQHFADVRVSDFYNDLEGNVDKLYPELKELQLVATLKRRKEIQYDMLSNLWYQKHQEGDFIFEFTLDEYYDMPAIDSYIARSDDIFLGSRYPPSYEHFDVSILKRGSLYARNKYVSLDINDDDIDYTAEPNVEMMADFFLTLKKILEINRNEQRWEERKYWTSSYAEYDKIDYPEEYDALLEKVTQLANQEYTSSSLFDTLASISTMYLVVSDDYHNMISFFIILQAEETHDSNYTSMNRLMNNIRNKYAN